MKKAKLHVARTNSKYLKSISSMKELLEDVGAHKSGKVLMSDRTMERILTAISRNSVKDDEDKINDIVVNAAAYGVASIPGIKNNYIIVTR